MQYSLAFLALAAGVLAQGGLQITDSVGASVLQVLATAIPPESISKATADPAAFSKELASSLSAGQTPEWYQALPSDVKSYLPQLYPAATSAVTTPAASSTAVSTVVSTEVISSVSVSASPSGGNNTVVSTVQSPTLSATGGDSSQTASGTGSESTGAAAYPTAMVGSGVAGAMGILAMLAL